MDDSLESLLEKATNPRNTYEDWEFIMSFCDKVNAHLQGPQVALRIVVPKIRSEDEKVAMLSLALLEACVKNCGQKFHQELGKFKFLNELIRMISPKYLGSTTPTVVKERIKELLYSWKVGLPHEAKINEAYLMLKREGLIFNENVDLDRTLEPDHVKPKVSLIQDPKQSQMLQKLLASKNPEDLRAANRLIREMVRRDEKRMQKLQKRMTEVDLIENNVKLLNELLLHLKEDSGEQERLLIEELYKSIDKMRPKIFRMASELKENEDGMSDILHTNDSVLRVMDLYKSKMERYLQPATGDGAVSTSTTTTSTSTASVATASKATATASGGGTVKDSQETSGSADQNGVSEATGGASDVLIDLADLNFDPMPLSVSSVGMGGVTGTDPNSSLGSLMDDISALDLGTPTSGINNLGMFPPPPAGVGGAAPAGVGVAAPAQAPFGVFQSNPPVATPPQGTLTTGTAPLISTSSSSNSTPSQPLIGTTSSLITIPPPPQQQQARSAGVGSATPHSSSPGMGLGLMGMGMGVQAKVQATPPLSAKVQVTPPSSPYVGGAPQQSVLDPLAVLDNMTVALDTIKPGSLSPMSVMNKNNLAITFYFTENSPAPGVSVIVISIISTSPIPVTNFQFQAAVPKVMRVKLQPPTATELGSYNPILPPPSISQIMLLANPSKAKIRMKYRISYNQGGGPEVVELGEASGFS